MQSKELNREGNKLQLMLTSKGSFPDSYNSYAHTMERSEEFVISCVVTAQIKNDVYKQNNSLTHQIISLNFNKNFQCDPLTYKLVLSSKVLKIRNMVLLVSECDKYSIQLLANSKAYIREFDVMLVFDMCSECSIFSPLYEDTDFTDFEIHCENGSIQVHKSVLISQSPVLRSMLSGPWKEAKFGTLEISKVKKEHLQQLKDYMYLQKVPNTDVLQLAALASYYMIPDLKRRCAVKLLGTLSADNAIDLLEFAVKYNIKILMLGVLDAVKTGRIKIEDIDQCCTNE